MSQNIGKRETIEVSHLEGHPVVDKTFRATVEAERCPHAGLSLRTRSETCFWSTNPAQPGQLRRSGDPEG